MKKLNVFQQSCLLGNWVSDTAIRSQRNIVKEWAIQALIHSEGVQDVAGRPHTVHARPPPPQHNNELDTTKREEEERRAKQNVACNI